MWCLFAQGKFDEAIELYKKAIAIWEKTVSPTLATGYNNLAVVYKKQVL